MGASLREEMVRLSLFGGKLALAELILFSVFLTDILLLGIMGEINLSGVLLANATFVRAMSPHWGSFRARFRLHRSGSRPATAAGITPSLRCRCCLAAAWQCWCC